MNHNQFRLMIVLGTRPEVIRFSPLITLLKKDKRFKLVLVHTGQHYSYNMDKLFFNQLDLPDPNTNLNLGPTSPLEQIGKIVLGMDSVLDKFKPNIVCVWGDTNSSLGACLAALKKTVPVAHIEAGYRSHDLRMSEEANRKLIDHCAQLLFPFCDDSKKNLKDEKVSGVIRKVGNPLLDIFLEKQKKYPGTDIHKKLKLVTPYILITTHRAENVDNPRTLKNILLALSKLHKFQIVFPVHPRTLSRIKNSSLGRFLEQPNVLVIDPVGYDEMQDLVIGCHMVITDSGGLQVEAFLAKKPCVTIRRSTEWTKTVSFGTNFLIDPENGDVSKTISFVIANHRAISGKFNNNRNPYGNGHGSKQILDGIYHFLQKNEIQKQP